MDPSMWKPRPHRITGVEMVSGHIFCVCAVINKTESPRILRWLFS